MKWALRDYQTFVRSKLRDSYYQDGHEGLASLALALTGEAGEVAEVVKKHAYHGKPLSKENLAEEIGDVLFYAAALADVLGVGLDEIINQNRRKLEARYPQKP